MLALAIQRRLERGTTDEEIDALVERFQREHELLFTVDTLEFLARGGRIGRACGVRRAACCNVKPILTIRDGEVVPLKRVRGKPEGVRRVRRRCSTPDSTDAPSLRVGIAHAARPSGCRAAAQAMVARVRPQAQIEVVDDARRRRRHARRARAPSASSGSTTRSDAAPPVRVLYSVPVAR